MSNEEREKEKVITTINSGENPTNIPDPYRDGEVKKVKDFFLGIILMIVEALIFIGLFTVLSDFGIYVYIFGIWFVLALAVIVNKILIVRLFKWKRKYIAFGMIVILPFLMWYILASYII